MNKLILTKGIPGSGKTTWSRAWVGEDPNSRVRVNRDDIRSMLGPYWVPSREDLVTRIENMMVQSAIGAGYDIVVDATNFKKTDRFVNMLPSSYEVEIKDFTDVPLEVCIERDKNRALTVGAEIVTNFYNKNIKDKDNG